MNNSQDQFLEVVEALNRHDHGVILEIPPSYIWDDIQAEVSQTGKNSKGELVLINGAKAKERQLDFKRLALASAAVFLIAFTVTYIIQSQSSKNEIQLAALSDFGGQASAIVDSSNISIVSEDLQAPAGFFYEVWLLEIDKDGELVDLVSIGKVNSDGSYEIPAGTDVDVFSTLDVSLEPDDGNDSHSGNSVLRGEVI